MNPLLRILAVLALFAGLSACRGGAADTGDRHAASPMELKIYEVAPEQLTSLQEALTKATSASNTRVTPLPPGKLLIYAPREQQASIAAAIETLGKSSLAAEAPRPLQMHFWMVVAQPGEAADDPALGQLAETLKPLRQSLGPVHFTLDESVAAVTDLGQRSSIRTAKMHDYQFRTSGNGQSIDLFLNYQLDVGMNINMHPTGLAFLETTISLRPGQYIVLAQAPDTDPSGSTPMPNNASPTAGAPNLRLLVARIDRLNPQP